MDRIPDPFVILAGGARAPSALTREDRVRLIGEFASSVLAGREPDQAALLFVAGALAAWLESGGSLEHDYLRTVKPKSHRTPAAIWREIRAHPDERQHRATGATLRPSTTTEDAE